MAVSCGKQPLLLGGNILEPFGECSKAVANTDWKGLFYHSSFLFQDEWMHSPSFEMFLMGFYDSIDFYPPAKYHKYGKS